MRVAVTGGRHFEDRDQVFDTLDLLAKTLGPIDLLIHGACTDPWTGELMGADRWADEWAWKRGVPVARCYANWSLGKKAGPIRNRKMLRDSRPMYLVAFPGGAGTKDCIKAAWDPKLDPLTIIKA